MTFLNFRGLLLAAAIFGLFSSLAIAQKSVENDLPLIGAIAEDGRSVALDWSTAETPRQYFVKVNRRFLGRNGGDSWRTIAEELRGQADFIDETVVPGQAYEYQVIRTGSDVVDVGYWVTGRDVSETAGGGNLYLVIDQTISEELALHLARYQRDMVAEGWRVLRLAVPRHTDVNVAENLQNASRIRIWLQQQYEMDPMGRHSVLLFGHVPILLSGRVAPDGHEPEPHATDLFYADMDGQWALNQQTLLVMNSTLPSDDIEMQIGRVDFADLGGAEGEVAHLQAYLSKNHHWRHGLHGDLREGYAKTVHLRVETKAMTNIFGQDAVTAGGHHDVGEAQPWLWGVDFGDHNGSVYPETYANKAVFAINFGSAKQKFQRRRNGMKMLMAQPFYPLAVGWGARPPWRLQHMALGGSIGDVHMRTVNNGLATEPYRESMDYWPTGFYLWRNPIWVNLLGDPTLRGFVLAPPSTFGVVESEAGNLLSWSASEDPDARGYRVYRVSDDKGVELIADQLPNDQTSFVDADGVAGSTYMVRAFGLKTVNAGSFWTVSQGIYAQTDLTDLVAPAVTISTTADEPVELPLAFQAPMNGRISTVIAPPEFGDLRMLNGRWRFTPQGFEGTIELPYSYSDPLRTAFGTLTIVVE